MKKNNSKFYTCSVFGFYSGNGIFWVRLLKWKLSFKHINDYKFSESEEKDPKGFFFYYWLINLTK